MKYWIIINGTQHGPMEVDELIAMKPSGSTPVWHEGLDNWVALNDVAVLREALAEADRRNYGSPDSAPRQDSPGNPAPEPAEEEETVTVIIEEKKAPETVNTEATSDRSHHTASDNSCSSGNPYPNPYGTPRDASYGNPSRNPYADNRTYPYGNPGCGNQGNPYGNQNNPYGHSNTPYGNRNYDGGNGMRPDGGNDYPPCPPTYLVWSILSIFLCCLPLGVVAVIYSSKVRPSYDRGDYYGACRASETAMWWLIAAIIIGIIGLPFTVLFSMMGL